MNDQAEMAHLDDWPAGRWGTARTYAAILSWIALIYAAAAIRRTRIMVACALLDAGARMLPDPGVLPAGRRQSEGRASRVGLSAQLRADRRNGCARGGGARP